MDPTTEAMTLDAITGAVTTGCLEILTRLSRRTRGKWRRRLTLAREGIPWFAPILVAGLRGASAAVTGGDPFIGAARGFAAGAFAVWVKSASVTAAKIRAAGAPDDGADQ
jgi:hypothetical protein